jgi:hypothetical protein
MRPLPSRRPWLWPAAGALLLGAAAAASGYATAPVSRPKVPPAPVPADGPLLVHGTVRARDGSELHLTTAAGPRDLKVTTATAFERLEPAALDGINAGDWLNVGAVPNRQTLFAITGLVVMSPDVVQGAPR